MTKRSVAVIFGTVMIGGTTTSAALPKPVITDFNINGSQLTLVVASVSNNVLTVETTDQLASNDWKSITTFYAPNENTVIDDYPFVSKSAAFSRVRIDPAGVGSNAPYHGWANALHISNGIVEATIVPDVGRIMQFGYVGTSGVFWQDRTKDGQSPNLAPGSAYKNFGGDKSWPAPQSDWSEIIDGQGGDWPPPTTFEVMTSHVSESGAEVVMKSAVDPYFGIQAIRRIRLFPGEPRMRVTTTFDQVVNITNQVSVWVVSHFADPEMVFVPIAENSMFPNGYHTIYSTPPDLTVSNNLISFTHNMSGNKIGSDSERLLGLGADYSLEISAPRIPGEAYPDSGSSMEVYTASDYVELEVLGPLTQLLPGESISLGMNYTLHPRVLSDPQLEAERILGNR